MIFLIFIQGHINFFIQINMQYIFFCHDLGRPPSFLTTSGFFESSSMKARALPFQTLIERNAPDAEIENDVQ